MAWVAVGATVVSGAINLYGQNKATKAQQKGADAATAEQARQFDQTRADQQPWLQAGQNAIGQIEQLNQGNFSAFMNSPDYLFARQQGLQGLDRSAAARGGFTGGGADADRIQFASGLATQNLGNFRNALQATAGLGQQTASNLGNLGANYASNVGNIGMTAANNRATSYQNNAGTWGQLATGVIGGINNWNQGRQRTQNPTSLGNIGNNPGWIYG